jgi:Etoposide-induced protein 2.4 (EI24)
VGPQVRALTDAATRALGYCLLPRVIALSFLPLIIAGGLAFAFMFFFWESAIDAVRATLEQWSVVEALLAFLDRVGLPQFRSVLAPLVLMAMLVPAVMAVVLLAVGLIMTPVIVKLVAQRRFPTLEARRGGSALVGVLAAVGATLAALLMLVASLPFLFIPPLVLVLPPLIWGWLTYKVFSYDVLAEHASAEERVALRREHRLPLLAIGVACGYLGAAPGLIFSFNAAAIFLAPFLILVSVWLYTWVFCFATAWYAHYALAALATRRGTAELVIE